MTEPNTDGLAALHAENHDPPEAIVSKLPKGKEDKSKRAGCRICGGYHDPSMFHLDYVGHADVTRVLIEADPLWSWEPMALTAEGLPAFDRDNQGQPVGLWIRLTVHGKTMLGYGSCEASKADGEKELIGDAIRNAAMRFGIALDLWSKADQTGEGGNRTTAPARAERPAPVDLTAVNAAIVDALAAGLEVDTDKVRAHAQQGDAQAAQAERVLRQRIDEHRKPAVPGDGDPPLDVCDVCGKPDDGHTHDAPTSQEGNDGDGPSPDMEDAQPQGDPTRQSGGDGQPDEAPSPPDTPAWRQLAEVEDVRPEQVLIALQPAWPKDDMAAKPSRTKDLDAAAERHPDIVAKVIERLGEEKRREVATA